MFRLIGGGDFFNASVTVDNVAINGPAGTVPEPASISLFTIGILSLITYGCYNHRRSGSDRRAKNLTA